MDTGYFPKRYTWNPKEVWYLVPKTDNTTLLRNGNDIEDIGQ